MKNEERKTLKEKYSGLYSEIEGILFKHDLVGINFGDNTDEYNPEVGTILPRLNGAKSKEDVADIVYEEFVRWFDEDLVRDKGDPAYMAIAKDVWEALEQYNKSTKVE